MEKKGQQTRPFHEVLIERLVKEEDVEGLRGLVGWASQCAIPKEAQREVSGAILHALARVTLMGSGAIPSSLLVCEAVELALDKWHVLDDGAVTSL